MHSTSLLGLLKEFRRQNLQNFVPSASAKSSAEGLIFLNESFGFGLMSKLRLRSYSGVVYTKIWRQVKISKKFLIFLVSPNPIIILNQKNLWSTLIYQFQHLGHPTVQCTCLTKIVLKPRIKIHKISDTHSQILLVCGPLGCQWQGGNINRKTHGQTLLLYTLREI